jgi:hypothetical protein
LTQVELKKKSVRFEMMCGSFSIIKGPTWLSVLNLAPALGRKGNEEAHEVFWSDCPMWVWRFYVLKFVFAGSLVMLEVEFEII